MNKKETLAHCPICHRQVPLKGGSGRLVKHVKILQQRVFLSRVCPGSLKKPTSLKAV